MSVIYIAAKIVTCDRCDKQITLKRLERKDLDGGYSHRDIYENTPDGWSRVDGKDLCPVCSDILDDLLEKFWLIVEE